MNGSRGKGEPSESIEGEPCEAVILDSTAFYAGVPYSSVLRYHTTDSVIDEVAHGEVRRTIIESLIQAGRLTVATPSESYVRLADEAARRSGDSLRLSETDVSVVALGLELRDRGFKVRIVSDDYSLENLARTLGLNIGSVLTAGIQKVAVWIIYCRGCGKTFKDGKVKFCDVCGTPLRRRVKKTRSDNSSGVRADSLASARWR